MHHGLLLPGCLRWHHVQRRVLSLALELCLSRLVGILKDIVICSDFTFIIKDRSICQSQDPRLSVMHVQCRTSHLHCKQNVTSTRCDSKDRADGLRKPAYRLPYVSSYKSKGMTRKQISPAGSSSTLPGRCFVCVLLTSFSATPAAGSAGRFLVLFNQLCMRTMMKMR